VRSRPKSLSSGGAVYGGGAAFSFLGFCTIPAGVVLEKVEKRFGDVRAVAGIDLTVRDQEFLILVGPSGCGKTTTLRMIAGLEEVTGGDIRIGGRSVVHLPPRDRD